MVIIQHYIFLHLHDQMYMKYHNVLIVLLLMGITLSVIGGVIIYFIGLIILKNDMVIYFKDMIKTKMKG